MASNQYTKKEKICYESSAKMASGMSFQLSHNAFVHVQLTTLYIHTLLFACFLLGLFVTVHISLISLVPLYCIPVFLLCGFL